MPTAHSRSHLLKLTECIREQRNESEQVLEEAERDETVASEILDGLEAERERRIERVNKNIDSRCAEQEKVKQDAQEAKRAARKLSANMKFMLGEINIFQLVWRTLT